MTTDLLLKLIDDNYCPITLRREFLQFHSLFKNIKQPVQIQIDAKTDHELLASIYSVSDGVIFGEEHFDNLSADFLTRNMRHLAQIGVKTFFFEGLHFGLERGPDGNRDEKDSAHEEYGALLDAARVNGIKIIGIDGKACKRGEGITRDIFMNIYAQDIINNTKDKGKWVALVGMMHLNNSIYINPLTFERYAVCGLSELTNSLSIILDSVDTDKNRYIKYCSTYSPSPEKTVNADFVIGIPHKKTPTDLRKAILQTSHFNSYKDLLELGVSITYYDIDNFARLGLQNKQYLKGSIFALIFEKLPPSPLETYKYNIKTALLPLAPHHWLDIKTDALKNEMIFSCHYEIAKKVANHTEEILLKSYVKAIA